MVFHDYKLIFVGIPKNGSTSVSLTLAPNSNNSYHSHRTIKKILENNIHLKDFYKATIKRNPYSRLCSAYTMMPGKFKTLKEKVNFLYNQITSSISIDVYNGEPHGLFLENYYSSKMEHVFKPQYYFICDNLGKICVDEILCLETIENDWFKFSSRFEGMPDKLLLENKTPIRDCESEWQKHFDSETIDKVNFIYKRDFELLDYDMIQP